MPRASVSLCIRTPRSKAAHSIVPDIDDGTGERLAIGAMNYTEEMGVGCIRLFLSDNGSAVRLDGDSGTVERSKNSREGGVVFPAL